MHRNTFIDSPRLLDAHLMLRGVEGSIFAGQITGAEGYVEAAACGAMAGIACRAASVLGLPPVEFPRETALGAVVAHLQNAASPDFQPGNVTWAWFSPLDRYEIRDKSERAVARWRFGRWRRSICFARSPGLAKPRRPYPGY